MAASHKSSWLPLLPAAALALLAGCDGAHGFLGDPLTGGPPIPPIPKKPYAPAGLNSGPSSATASGGLPALPGTHSLGSQAALAGGVNPAPDPGRELRIGVPGVPTSQSSARGAAPAGPVLGAPELVTDSTSRLVPVANTVPGGSVAPAPSAVPGGPSTFEQAQQMLHQRGVTWQRLETVGETGQWRFRCSIPNREAKSLSRVYDVTVQGADGLPAIRAAIDKIDQDVGRR